VLRVTPVTLDTPVPKVSLEIRETQGIPEKRALRVIKETLDTPAKLVLQVIKEIPGLLANKVAQVLLACKVLPGTGETPEQRVQKERMVRVAAPI
jgi:hypothetical protein